MNNPTSYASPESNSNRFQRIYRDILKKNPPGLRPSEEGERKAGTERQSGTGHAFDHFRRIYSEAQQPSATPHEWPLMADTAPNSGQPGGFEIEKTDITPGRDISQTGVEGRHTLEKTQTPYYKPAPPPLGSPPQKSPPALGTEGLPLPRRVREVDDQATQISPNAYANTAAVSEQRRRGTTSTYASSSTDQGDLPPDTGQDLYRTTPGLSRGQKTTPQHPVRRQPGSDDWQKNAGCLLRTAVIGTFLTVVILLLAGSVLLFQYYSIARTLPNIEELRQRASQFETTRIYDRKGGLLYEILDPNAGRRTYVPLDKVSPFMIAATLATEDKEFYSHPGYDAMAILRAFWQNYTSGEVVSGASTITQQLARTLLFSPEERSQKSYQRKMREAVLAAEITRRYTKDEILELYLNEIYYGNLAYGVEAAAQTYFNSSAENLSLPQAAFLAGLPQAPSVYDVFTNRDAAIKRTEEVLFLMFQASKEQGCIFVSNNRQPVCVDAVQAATAATEMKNFTFQKNDIKIQHPHWVNYIRSLLEQQYDSQTIYRSGFSVYTTLDPELQSEAERIVNQQVASLQGMNAHSGALVAIHPVSGEILAMVGSADYFGDKQTGQINMAVSPRQPGSAIKPVTYAAAFEKGWTPATLIWDVPTEFPALGTPGDQNSPYRPVNYDGRYHGPVTVRYALANSYNIPAVKTLQFVGIYGDPNKPGESGMVGMAERLGITTLTRKDYGLSLTLGGGDVNLLELSAAYAVFAAGGQRIPPVAITRIVDYGGNEIFRYEPPPGNQVLSSAHAFLISSILSDNEARSAAFGADSVLNMPFQAAVKTGTTNDFRDNWTIGYTPDLVVGVWVGNPDYTPMVNTTGLTGAAPIWADFMQIAVPKITNGSLTPFTRPADVSEYVVCAISGTQPSQWCPSQYTEFFAPNQPPLPKEQDLWRESLVDTWTNLLASRDCADFAEKIYTMNISDPWAIRWVSEDAAGRAWAQEMGFSATTPFTPERECNSTDPRPILSFAYPHEGETIQTSPLAIYAIIGANADFSEYGLFYGVGREPQEWHLLAQGTNQYSKPEKIAEWDISQLPAGEVTLRLYLTSTRETFAEKLLHLRLQVPTPTTTATPTTTQTPTPTITATSSATTAPPSDTPNPASETPSLTPEASATTP